MDDEHEDDEQEQKEEKKDADGDVISMTKKDPLTQRGGLIDTMKKLDHERIYTFYQDFGEDDFTGFLEHPHLCKIRGRVNQKSGELRFIIEWTVSFDDF